MLLWLRAGECVYLWPNSRLHYIIGTFTLPSADEERIGKHRAKDTAWTLCHGSYTNTDRRTSQHTDTNSPHRIRKTNYIKSCCLVSSSEGLNLSFCWQSVVSLPVMWAHFINLSFFISSSALEKEAHRERHCHHNLSGARSAALHPSEYPLTLPACLCHCPCAQPLRRKHLL